MQVENAHNNNQDDDTSAGDGEGVWSPIIEQCFQEALIMFPPCGRRKTILPEEGGSGKMFGRNELIARYILLRTGKKRTRKQVSSHIQVLARRKAKSSPASSTTSTSSPSSSHLSCYDTWADREIVTQKLRLVEFSAFTTTTLQANHLNTPSKTPQASTHRHDYIKIDYRLNRQPTTSGKLEQIDVREIHDKFHDLAGLIHKGTPDAFFLVKFWADLNTDFDYIQDRNSYSFSSQFETIDLYKNLMCSTKACSYGLQVVEKVERIQPVLNTLNGRYNYSTNRSPMCDFMKQFIKKLHQLPKREQMNSVLENFTVLQVITSESTNEILLCLAYVFEISCTQENGPEYHIYRLTSQIDS